jgi:cytochrome c-type biogenesis protein CcmH/NrfG
MFGKQTDPLRTRAKLAGAGLICLAAVLAFANGATAPFIFDDRTAIQNDRRLDNPGACTSEIMADHPQTALSGRPISCLTFALNRRLHGLSVPGYHAVSIALHVGCAVLVMLMAARSLARSGIRDLADAAGGLSLITALLFAVHPLQTEAVTYIVQRTELLASFFFLLTVFCASRSFESAHGRAWAAGAIVACGLGMGSKEIVAGAPLAVLVYDRVFHSRSFALALRDHWRLYTGLALTWTILAVLVLKGPRSETAGFGLEVEPIEYLRTQAEVILTYLKLVFWPSPLILWYYWPIAQSWGAVLPAVVLVAILLATTVWAIWVGRPEGFAGAVFFLVLAPSSSFVPIVTEVAAERRMYLPLAAVIALVASLTYVGLRRSSWARWPAVTRWTGVAVVAGLAMVFAGMTIARNADYRDPIRMWQDVISKQPEHPSAHFALGDVLLVQGRQSEAIAHYRESLRLAPDHPGRSRLLGEALLDVGQVSDAMPHLRTAVRVQPDDPWHHLALGRGLTMTGDYEGALREFQQALARSPARAPALTGIGVVLSAQGRSGEALDMFKQALAADPGYVEAKFNSGILLASAGDHAAAVAFFEEVLALLPQDAGARLALARSQEALGRIEAARQQVELVLQRDPANAEARQAMSRLTSPSD